MHLIIQKRIEFLHCFLWFYESTAWNLSPCNWFLARHCYGHQIIFSFFPFFFFRYLRFDLNGVDCHSDSSTSGQILQIPTKRTDSWGRSSLGPIKKLCLSSFWQWIDSLYPIFGLSARLLELCSEYASHRLENIPNQSNRGFSFLYMDSIPRSLRKIRLVMFRVGSVLCLWWAWQRQRQRQRNNR
jgi:hypothetical protein